MKKRVLSGAAALGLLLLGAAAWPQDAPTFRDVLRGKVGQKCQARALHGIWVLQFSNAAGGEAGEKKEPDPPLPARVPAYTDVIQMLEANGVKPPPGTVNAIRNEALVRVSRELIEEYIDGNVALVQPTDVLTVAAVGQDFVQLREGDGTERFIPLSRVEVVVRPAGK